MLRIIALFACLGVLVSCSSQPTSDSSASSASCNSGDCIKNLNKLATPPTGQSAIKSAAKKKAGK